MTCTTMTRREAVQRLAMLALAPRMASAEWEGDSRAVTLIDRPGVQLYTVRQHMRESVERTIARVAGVGFSEVEFAGYFGRSPSQIAEILKANGLTAPSAHIDIALLRGSLERTLDDAVTAGHRYVTVAWVDAKERTREGYRRLADDFNAFGTAASARGLRFAYHNHEFEFSPLGSDVPYDLLLARTDAAVVDFQLDLFWMTKAGRQPVDYLTRFPGRFPLVHVKDMAADRSMVDPGAGTIDFRAIYRAANGAIKHSFVEHDEPTDAFASITAGFNFLRGLSPR